ncbi:hypothetical protein [Methylobacterium radiotolerans]
MTANVPAVVVGWEEDGLRVRLIEPFGKFDVDAEVSARPAVARRGDSDVTIQKKRQGLRLGGVVVLLKASEGENGLEWRGLDTLKEKADQSEVRVFRRTPVTIFPPAEKQLLVDRAAILLVSSAVSFQSITASIKAIEYAVEEGCLYGRCGLLIRGPDKKGRIHHHFVPPLEERNAAVVMRTLMRQRLGDMLRHARDGRGSWKAIPYVEMATDRLHSSRMSADRINLPYPLPDGSPGFKLCTAAIRYSSDDWTLSDATPLSATPEVFGFDAPDALAGLAAELPSARSERADAPT